MKQDSIMQRQEGGYQAGPAQYANIDQKDDGKN